ncbi:tetratricopeptide repeat protein [Maribacter algarum]|uniref:Tetratricopeptide repeat protein n=1 Tax=Maribacter algarum (ex Zhang et al. 2020) TaxID=2578118 RepID=A0A5S3PNF6_9FLAO|nr:tetratricopeptide repeat protein [Maribacter algarum]TMM55956.1 tetratricopeptide repeat protein [Maribacter algarum]
MNTAKKINSIILLLCIPVAFWAQNTHEIDSLLKSYETQVIDTVRIRTAHNIFNYYLKDDYKQAEKYAEEMLTLAQKTKNPNFLGIAYRNLGNYNSRISKVQEALDYARKARDQFKKANNTNNLKAAYSDLLQRFYTISQYDSVLFYCDEQISLLSSEEKDTTSNWSYVLKVKSIVYANQGKNVLALKNGIASLKYAEDDYSKIGTLGNLGKIESARGNYKQSLEFDQEALRLAKRISRTFQIAQISNNLGDTYLQMKDYAKAKESFQYAEKIAREKGHAVQLAAALGYQGELAISENQFKVAQLKYKESAQLFKKISPINYAIALTGLASAHNKLENYTEAIPFLDEAIPLLENPGALDYLKDSFKERAIAYEGMQLPALALRDFKKFKIYNDSIFNESKSEQIEELRAIYDTEKKEQQIAQQETEISLLEEKEKVSRLQKIALGGGLGLSVLLAGFGFYGFRQKMKSNKLEREKIETELEFKKKELTTHALHLAKKNEVLEQVKQKAKELKSVENIEKGYQTLVQTINFDQQDDRAWENFTQYFEAVHKDFAKHSVERYPAISKNELRLMALLKMNMSSKEIGSILNISADGVKKARQRLRKKMQLSPQDSLETTVMAI